MCSVFLLATLLATVSNAAKTPRIYNVLISTKKNLSPSHAIPVYEPVLKTTSVGLAFPPLIYHTAYPQFQTIHPLAIQPYTIHTTGLFQGYAVPQDAPAQNGNLAHTNTEDQSAAPAPVEQFISYSSTNGLLSMPQEYNKNPSPVEDESPQKVNKFAPIPANLKRNPEIPDVPPPPIPVKSNP